MNKRSISGYLEEDGAGGESSKSVHIGHRLYNGQFCSMYMHSLVICKTPSGAACRGTLWRREQAKAAPSKASSSKPPSPQQAAKSALHSCR